LTSPIPVLPIPSLGVRIAAVWSLIVFLPLFSFSQNQTDSIPEKKAVEKLFDFGDLVVDKLSGDKWTVIPAVIYSPETSLGLGARAIRVFRHKNKADSLLRPSSLPITFLYTLNNQAILTTELDLWADQNKSYFNGRLELSRFPFKYFGIGNEPQLEEGEVYTTRYAYLHLFYQRKIAKGIYFGPRYEFRLDNITDRVAGGLLENSQVPGYDGQRLSGLGLILQHDTRDILFQPTRGWYNRLQWMVFSQTLGSQYDFQHVVGDLRRYISVGKRQVIALQAWSSFTWGTPTFQHLSLIGGSDVMRGFFEGKFRDRHALVFQGEYRLPIYRNLGMVFFGHTGQVAPEIRKFGWQRFRYGAGVGFRYRINSDGLNIRLDFAIGDQKAIYFGLNEVI
jgi:outer membrane protein assembly factor BamA